MASYLQPLIESLRILACEGVEASHPDGQPFTLKAHLITVSGDMPAISKVSHGLFPPHSLLIALTHIWCPVYQLMMFKGVNAKLPCRFCNLLASPSTSSGDHVTYYTTLSPPGRKSYQALRLPLRSDQEAKESVREIRACTSRKEREAKQVEKGINGDSKFHAIGSIDFAASFTPDIMHILFENIMKQLLNLWDGSSNARQ
ncbi:hypothetical protein QFC22_003824 [Naganishia vaughanmartiniae]|nr:hypothetical protein QFC22_003824 [Naganishia vaughanmartiniae]